jgi:hypothetical protein
MVHSFSAPCSSEPALATLIVFHVAVALSLTKLGEAQIELFDIFILA